MRGEPLGQCLYEEQLRPRLSLQGRDSPWVGAVPGHSPCHPHGLALPKKTRVPKSSPSLHLNSDAHVRGYGGRGMVERPFR